MYLESNREVTHQLTNLRESTCVCSYLKSEFLVLPARHTASFFAFRPGTGCNQTGSRETGRWCWRNGRWTNFLFSRSSNSGNTCSGKQLKIRTCEWLACAYLYLLMRYYQCMCVLTPNVHMRTCFSRKYA